MKSFVLMLTFFTRIPIKYSYEYSREIYIKGIKYISLIGLIIGLILYAVSLLGYYIDKPVVSLILVFTYLWVTGGLHLDGLADTCDGIFSGREKTKMLEIMKDSRIGTFGVVSLILIFLSYLIFFNYIDIKAFILFPIIGKSSAVISGYISEYAREEGMGKDFIDNCNNKELIITVVFSLLLCVLFKSMELFISAILTFLIVLLIIKHIKSKLDGITGDTIGFIVETSQIIFLFATYILNIFIKQIII